MEQTNEFIQMLVNMSKRIEKLENEVKELREQKQDKTDPKEIAKQLIEGITALGNNNIGGIKG